MCLKMPALDSSGWVGWRDCATKEKEFRDRDNNIEVIGWGGRWRWIEVEEVEEVIGETNGGEKKLKNYLNKIK